jgi:ferritin-like metal-binding protein YciE
MAELTARELKLIQYLNEAYGTERQLEAALEAHINMTTRASYKKRLQEHLRETKRHARDVERRVKKLGGSVKVGPIRVPEVATEAATSAALRVQSGIGKATALAQGPVHALRGTGEQEKLLKNAKTEYASEAEEIATYTAIQSLAESVGDRETVQLARGILREEQRMARFLERLIPTLTRAVATAEIPAAQRDGGRRRTSRRRRTSASRARSTTRSRSTSRSRASSRSGSGSARLTRSGSAGRSRGAARRRRAG